MSFWLILLAGLDWFLRAVVEPLFGGPAGYHQAMGLQNSMGQGAWVAFELAYATFTTFDLTIPILAFSMAALAWLINIVIAIYLRIKSLIPGAG